MANLYKKEDLVARVAEKMTTEDAKVSKVKAKEIVDTVVDSIKELMADESHDGVDIFGFGKFEVKEVPERQGRNPQTGEPMTISAHYAPKCRFSQSFKNILR